MKGSTLTFTIIDGEFDGSFEGISPETFEPMIRIIRYARVRGGDGMGAG